VLRAKGAIIIDVAAEGLFDVGKRRAFKSYHVAKPLHPPHENTIVGLCRADVAVISQRPVYSPLV
jgi:hypothetical protein